MVIVKANEPDIALIAASIKILKNKSDINVGACGICGGSTHYRYPCKCRKKPRS